jgi:two-component system response regulator TctD
MLLIEDNEKLAALVAQGLTKAGWFVDVLRNASDAKMALATVSYSAIILDLGPPAEEGLVFLRVLRRQNDPTPVLVLTSRTTVRDRVTALHAGADDYLIKPCAMEELIARLQAVLRRPSDVLGGQLVLGNVSLDTVGRHVSVGKATYTFSARETLLLEILLRNARKVVRRAYLDEQLFGSDGGGESNAVDVYAHRLRKVLEKAQASVAIHTIRGIGYLLAEGKST